MRITRANPSRIGGAICVMACLFLCFPLMAQQENSLTSLLAALKSPNWDDRYAAYEKIKENQEALKRSDVRDALVNLLDRENQYVHKTLEDSNGGEGVGESFGEYQDDLALTLMEIINWKDAREVCILAESDEDALSEMSVMLVEKGGGTMIPCLLKIAKGTAYDHQDSEFMLSVDRTDSIPKLVALGDITPHLTTDDRQRIQEATFSGLRDKDLAVRQETVRAVGEYGTPDLIPVLQEIARSDPYSRPTNNGNRSYDVRNLATKAIQSIQERAKVR